ncbi:PHP domain-containing protein [Gephyromycinifex aptenodytis]|uniref:PHP domain-containing protein n=1 Tax=Gephyromycinifex aptenodytis TaxID=2716227 RepID=UPI0014479CA9|nr:PHP domain-containing protein [Gephyromycinifex aptenodytis]
MRSAPENSADAWEPIDALRRIAFLLERTQGQTRKIEAFRKAAAAVMAVPPQELQARAEAGTLQELPAIGASTGKVIAQCLAGQEPEYLQDLASLAGPLAQDGQELLAQLRGDLHSHSDWSDGGAPIQEMVATAMELGRDYLVLSDHSPRLRVANGLSPERLANQIVVVEHIDEHLETTGEDFRLLTGIEVDILDDGSLDQDPRLLDRLDVVVASVHSKLRMERSAMTRRMLAAVRNPRVNVLGHCTGRLVAGGRGTRPQSQFDAAAVFAACAENDVAVEINSRPERCDPPDELITLALEAGCLFSIDTDAHAPGQLDFLAYGAERAQRLQVPPERIVTTWGLDRLLGWSRP